MNVPAGKALHRAGQVRQAFLALGLEVDDVGHGASPGRLVCTAAPFASPSLIVSQPIEGPSRNRNLDRPGAASADARNEHLPALDPLLDVANCLPALPANRAPAGALELREQLGMNAGDPGQRSGPEPHAGPATAEYVPASIVAIHSRTTSTRSGSSENP